MSKEFTLCDIFDKEAWITNQHFFIPIEYIYVLSNELCENKIKTNIDIQEASVINRYLKRENLSFRFFPDSIGNIVSISLNFKQIRQEEIDFLYKISKYVKKGSLIRLDFLTSDLNKVNDTYYPTYLFVSIVFDEDGMKIRRLKDADKRDAKWIDL